VCGMSFFVFVGIDWFSDGLGTGDP